MAPVVEQQPLAGEIDERVGGRSIPVAGATVIVTVGADTVRAQTDENGHFQLSVRAERQLSVTFKVTKDGYEDYRNSATLGNTGLGFSLTRSKR
jgi:phosphatidate phosphatase APP1